MTTRLLAISDLHGDLASAWAAVEAAQPDVLLCCGDWGDPGEVSAAGLRDFTERLPVFTVYGNHDDLELLRAWENQDGSPVLLDGESVVEVGGLRLAGINGIWAKSHRQPYYVTDEDVASAAAVLAQQAPVDLLLSHGCPAGVADLTQSGRHGGQRCFLEAFRLIQPRLYLTGHLHRAQQHVTREGQTLRNVGSTPRGDATIITVTDARLSVEPLSFSP